MRGSFILATALLAIDPNQMEMIQAPAHLAGRSRPATICHAKTGLAISFNDYCRFSFGNNTLHNLPQPLANVLRNFHALRAA